MGDYCRCFLIIIVVFDHIIIGISRGNLKAGTCLMMVDHVLSTGDKIQLGKLRSDIHTPIHHRNSRLFYFFISNRSLAYLFHIHEHLINF